MAAHNASFDQRILRACRDRHDIKRPPAPFRRTARISREVWDIRSTKPPDVRGKLGIEPEHDEALSDARARAQIVMAAHAILEPTRRVVKPREVRALGANP